MYTNAHFIWSVSFSYVYILDIIMAWSPPERLLGKKKNLNCADLERIHFLVWVGFHSRRKFAPEF